jgi:hypothetical protein
MTVTINSQFNHRKSEVGRKELNNKLGGLEKIADFGQVLVFVIPGFPTWRARCLLRVG